MQRGSKMKLLLVTLLTFNIFAADVDLKVEKFDWNGIEVTWLEDNTLPTYDVIFYFADGALSDGSRKGETDMMFQLLRNGTNRFSRGEISDNLEFFGTDLGANVIHEYSTYNISGLTKDIIPTVKKVCHLFKDAVYPDREVTKYKKLLTNKKKNIVNNHGHLASVAFREITLKGTPFVYPVTGKIKTIRKINSRKLRNKLNYFNTKVKKKVYLTGPKSVLNIKNIVLNECGWDSKASFVREINYKYKDKKPAIHLVTVGKANQAQVMAGRFLPKGTFEDYEKLDVLGQYLGGGFTSVLMKELRVKRGLTYSAHAVASGQKEYGRAVISTFTKEETVGDLLTVLKDILKNVNESLIPTTELKLVKDNLIGSYPFQFEKSSSFLRQLMFLDHINQNYKRLYKYNEFVKDITPEQIQETFKNVFPHNGVDIVILGEKKLAKKLKKFGEVKIHNYKNFL
jgi:zinc protease